MLADLRAHCAEIDRCNQRGGRMLSMVDLLDAGTFTAELAAYSLAAIGQGASFMVGALPGGAGKTTVMGALLNFVPAGVSLVPADGMAAIESGLRASRPRCCFVCHEIGAGPYYAYLWNGVLRRFFELPGNGHMLATNLHADTYQQAVAQVCGQNRVPVPHFQRMNMLYFLTVEGGGRHASRRVTEVWESDGDTEHRRVFPNPEGRSTLCGSRLVTPEAFRKARGAIAALSAAGVRSIEQVRAHVLATS
ncbi:MAG: hypothetical protein JXR77_18020 [Lentisphaeria bacterium]|nr:hypothetical protein [Lentisphaeria bacterium]